MLIMLQTYKYINTWGIMNTLKSILLNLQRVDKAKKKKIYRGRQSRQNLSVQGTQHCFVDFVDLILKCQKLNIIYNMYVCNLSTLSTC